MTWLVSKTNNVEHQCEVPKWSEDIPLGDVWLCDHCGRTLVVRGMRKFGDQPKLNGITWGPYR